MSFNMNSTKYPTSEKLDDMLSIANALVTSFDVPVKKKREDEVRIAYGNTYDVQIEIMNIIKLIQTSHILGMNEVIIFPIVDEYCRLKAFCELLQNELSRMKSMNEYEHIKLLMNTFKPATIMSMLYEDLTFIQGTFVESLDINKFMVQAKAYKMASTDKKHIEYKLDSYYRAIKNPRNK
jgi:hypothetical protein